MGGKVIVIGLGSNVAATANVRSALRALCRVGVIERRAELVRTDPVGPPGQPPYVNTAVRLRYTGSLGQMRRTLRAIEADLGRVRTSDRCAPRPIDLDVLSVDDEVVDPDVPERPWLLGALLELAPGLAPPPRDETTERPEIGSLVAWLESRLGLDRIAIFGAGRWFAGEPCPTSDVDFVAMVRPAALAREMILRAEFAARATPLLGSRPVRLRLFGEDELRFGSERTTLLRSPAHARLYLRQMRHWRLLSGSWDPAVWPAPLHPSEEMRLLAPTITHPPDVGFLADVAAAPDERFDWPNLVRLALFWEALVDHASGNDYTPSLRELGRRHASEPEHPVHRALAYREYGYAVRPARRRRFHRALCRAVTSWLVGRP